jgi:uncharacterized protein YciI
MFLVDMQFLRPLDEIDQHIAAHREHLAQHYAKGTLLMGGRKVPRSGGIILSRHASRDEVLAVFEADPLVLAGVASYSVIEFQPVMMQEELRPLFC